MKALLQANARARRSAWLAREEEAVEEGYEPMPSREVQVLFTKFAFMPLPIGLVFASNTAGVRLCRARSDVCRAIPLDISLLPAIVANGE